MRPVMTTAVPIGVTSTAYRNYPASLAGALLPYTAFFQRLKLAQDFRNGHLAIGAVCTTGQGCALLRGRGPAGAACGDYCNSALGRCGTLGENCLWWCAS